MQDLLKVGIFYVLSIDELSNFTHLNISSCFILISSKFIENIIPEILKSYHHSYHVIFYDKPDPIMLQKLVHADTNNSIVKVRQVDIILMPLLPNVSLLNFKHLTTKKQELTELCRTLEYFSQSMNFTITSIAYHNKSFSSGILATRLSNIYKEEVENMSSSKTRATLLIISRMDDLITPMLKETSYLEVLNECKDNPDMNDIKHQTANSILYSGGNDIFFMHNCYSDLQILVENIQLTSEYLTTTNENLNKEVNNNDGFENISKSISKKYELNSKVNKLKSHTSFLNDVLQFKNILNKSIERNISPSEMLSRSGFNELKAKQKQLESTKESKVFSLILYLFVAIQKERFDLIDQLELSLDNTLFNKCYSPASGIQPLSRNLIDSEEQINLADCSLVAKIISQLKQNNALLKEFKFSEELMQCIEPNILLLFTEGACPLELKQIQQFNKEQSIYFIQVISSDLLTKTGYLDLLTNLENI